MLMQRWDVLVRASSYRQKLSSASALMLLLLHSDWRHPVACFCSESENVASEADADGVKRIQTFSSSPSQT